MAQVTSYPYQLSESILTSSPTDMWTDPLLYEDILPPRKAQVMNTTLPSVPTALQTWRPARVFPSEKYVSPVCSPPTPATNRAKLATCRYVGAAAQVVYPGISRLPMVA